MKNENEIRKHIASFVLVFAMTLAVMPFGRTADLRNDVNPVLDPPEDCFASNPGAGNTNKLDHATWARSQGLDALTNDLWGKIVMVYGCKAVSDDQAFQLFGELSGLVARRAPDARCFGGDRGVINQDDKAHESWARSRSRTVVRDNLGAKAIAALKCLDEGHNRVDFFATASMLLAMAPTRSGNAFCTGQYGVGAPASTRTGAQITVNFSAPKGHSERDWIGIFPENVIPAEGRTVAWQWVPKDPCGYVVMRAPAPGRYYVYYLGNGGYSPIGGGRLMIVTP